MSLNLSRVQESRISQQAFTEEIERLKQVIGSKEGELRSQRLEMAKVIQKIELVYQEQLKVIRIIENTYSEDARRDLDLNSQLADLKDYIGKLSQATSFTLQDIFQQGGNIVNFLTKHDSDLRLKLQDNTSHYHHLLSQKEQELLTLRQQLDNAQLHLREREDSSGKQQEIFDRIVELTRENAAIKEQLNFNSSEHESELDSKNHSILQLESRIKEIDRLQKKELQELRDYISQRESALSEAVEEVRRLLEEASDKDRTIERLSA
jgi:chromosome segregation ATPase